MGLPYTTVEVFHDVECGRQDIDEVLTGIEIVNGVALGIQVVRTDRQMRISDPAAKEVQPAAIRWPNLQTDITFVITERPILRPTAEKGMDFAKETPREVSGIEVSPYASGISLRKPGVRLAIISTYHGSDTPGITAHETAHLFNIKREGEKLDPESPGHCIDASCLLFPVSRLTKADVVTAGLSHRKAKKLKDELGYDRLPDNHPDCFCDECSQQLAASAHRERMSRL